MSEIKPEYLEFQKHTRQILDEARKRISYTPEFGRALSDAYFETVSDCTRDPSEFLKPLPEAIEFTRESERWRVETYKSNLSPNMPPEVHELDIMRKPQLSDNWAERAHIRYQNDEEALNLGCDLVFSPSGDLSSRDTLRGMQAAPIIRLMLVHLGY